ncbi:MAG: hypothetical protein ACKPEA_15535, partial [Planctomycetota bacterium]
MARSTAGKTASKATRNPTSGAAKPAAKGGSVVTKRTATIEAKPTRPADMNGYQNALKWLYERTDIER